MSSHGNIEVTSGTPEDIVNRACIEVANKCVKHVIEKLLGCGDEEARNFEHFFVLKAEVPSESTEGLHFLRVGNIGDRNSLVEELRAVAEKEEGQARVHLVEELRNENNELRNALKAKSAYHDEMGRYIKSLEATLSKVDEMCRTRSRKLCRAGKMTCDVCSMEMNSRQVLSCRCGLAFYCSRDCQKKHWNTDRERGGHKLVCTWSSS